MALILRDGFDVYNGIGANTGLASKWTANVATGGSLVTGRFGGQALQVVGNTNTFRSWSKSLDSAQSSFAIGVAINLAASSTNVNGATIVTMLSGSTSMVSIGLDSASRLFIARNSSVQAWTVLATATNSLPTGTWVWLDLEVTISDTVGVMNLYVNNDTTTYGCTVSSADTRNGTPTTCDTLRLGVITQGSGTGAPTVQYDDALVADSASKIGERRIETIYPTSDVSKVWAPNTGTTNYTQVSEAQADGDTSYVQGTSVGDTDRYGFGDLSSTPTSIDGIQVSCFAEKTDAGTRSIALQVKSGATVSDGANFGLASLAYGKFERWIATDPATSAAFTGSAVNALQGGPKVTV